EIHGRINVNVALIGVLLALVLPTRNQPAREFAEESSRAALGFHMRDGGGNRNPRVPFDNVKSRRAVFALAANYFAALEAPAHDGTSIQAEESSGNALEYGKLLQ